VRGVLPQFLRFVAVGVSNSVVDFGVFNLLAYLFPTADLGVLVLYNSLGVALAIVNSYLWNTRWTFRGAVATGHRVRRQQVLFVAQALLNVGVNDAVVATLTRLLFYQTILSQSASSNVAKLAGMLVASAFSFLVMKYVVFA
jgi:putative flippase GtrA